MVKVSIDWDKIVDKEVVVTCYKMSDILLLRSLFKEKYNYGISNMESTREAFKSRGNISYLLNSGFHGSMFSHKEFLKQHEYYDSYKFLDFDDIIIKEKQEMNGHEEIKYDIFSMNDTNYYITDCPHGVKDSNDSVILLNSVGCNCKHFIKVDSNNQIITCSYKNDCTLKESPNTRSYTKDDIRKAFNVGYRQGAYSDMSVTFDKFIKDLDKEIKSS